MRALLASLLRHAAQCLDPNPGVKFEVGTSRGTITVRMPHGSTLEQAMDLASRVTEFAASPPEPEDGCP